MNEADTTRLTRGVEPPVRTVGNLPQCRCVLLNGSGTHGDRCAHYVPDPDSPLCDHCEVHHRGFIEQGIEFAMMPLDH